MPSVAQFPSRGPFELAAQPVSSGMEEWGVLVKQGNVDF